MSSGLGVGFSEFMDRYRRAKGAVRILAELHHPGPSIDPPSPEQGLCSLLHPTRWALIAYRFETAIPAPIRAAAITMAAPRFMRASIAPRGSRYSRPAIRYPNGCQPTLGANLMTPHIQPVGPEATVRPFTPVYGEEDPAERIAHALEHIAVALSALDHNVETMLAQIRAIAHVLPKLTP
jgi:hypothetical protein